MKKINFNRAWEFNFDKNIEEYTSFGVTKYGEATGAARRFLDCNNWEKIDLPHDWAVGLPKNFLANTIAGGRGNSRFNRQMTEKRSELDESEIFEKGWYRKSFDYDPAWEGKTVYLELEGVYRDYTVFVNGTYVDRSFSGYTSFCVDITDHLRNDGKRNSIAVYVDCSQTEGWWYEGSGIYRNVNLLVGEKVYFEPYKTVIKSEVDGTVSVTARLCNETESEISEAAVFTVTDREGNAVASATAKVEIEPYSATEIAATVKIDSPRLWDVESPELYTLNIKCRDEYTERFGIRSIVMDPDKGCILNGRQIKLRGACVHQDFGGVGVALTDNLQRYKIMKLKEMGCNAYRCAHNPPAPALLDACDELGMLVMDETRAFGTSPEAIRQLTSLVERDRNHPSVFMWSIGNEEMSIQMHPWAKDMALKVCRILRGLDDTRLITYAGNDGFSDTGINAAVDVRGINYIRNTNGVDRWVEKWHEKYPDQPMLGSEESSYVLNRGGTVTELGSSRLDCSGDVTMWWGETPKGWVKFYEERPHLAGGFMWTGFDYRGEPSPFWMSMVSSNFGTIDLCGMEKPPFYYYKAWWTDESFVKIAPHWDYKAGEEARVLVYTNCDRVELYVNGRLVGEKNVERFENISFTVPFEAGSVKAVAYKDGREYTDTLVTPGEIASVRVKPVLLGEGEEDISIYQLEGVDKDGNICHNAMNSVEFTAENCVIVGVGNGDAADMDNEQKPKEYEEKFIREFDGGKYRYYVNVKEPNKFKNVKSIYYREEKQDYFESDYRLIAGTDYAKLKDEERVYVHNLLCAEDYEYIEIERFGGDAEVYLNGELIGSTVDACSGGELQYRPFRFYGNFNKGVNRIEIRVKKHEFEGSPFSGYVKVGRELKTPWQVRLYYGIARVFVRNGANAVINARLK